MSFSLLMSKSKTSHQDFCRISEDQKRRIWQDLWNWKEKAKNKEVVQKCNCPDVKFATVEELKDHWTHVHNYSNPFSCFNCPTMPMEFSTIGSMRGHWNSYHGQNAPGRFEGGCAICGEVFYAELDLKIHNLTDHFLTSAVGCSYCRAVCCNLEGLAEHWRTIHHTTKHSPLDDDRYFKCGICNLELKSGPEFKLHLKTEHLGVNRMVLNPFACLKCPERFHCWAKLQRHVVATHNFRTKAIVRHLKGQEKLEQILPHLPPDLPKFARKMAIKGALKAADPSKWLKKQKIYFDGKTAESSSSDKKN